MQRLVTLVLVLLPALAGSVSVARSDPASDGTFAAAPWLAQLQQPYTGSTSSLAAQQQAFSPVAIADGMLRPLQHAANAATRAISQVFGVSRSSPAVPGAASRHSARVMRRHFVNDTDPSAVCNDGTPGTHHVQSTNPAKTLTADLSAAATTFVACGAQCCCVLGSLRTLAACSSP